MKQNINYTDDTNDVTIISDANDVEDTLKPVDNVSEVTDYTFHQGLDSDGGDLIYLGGKTIKELKAYCDNNHACLGFNTNG